MFATKAQHDKALHIIENPEYAEGLQKREAFHRILRLWRIPSFDAYSSWSVYKDAKVKKRMWVRRLEWNHRKEFPSQTYPPRVVGSEGIWPFEEYEAQIGKLKKIEMKPFLHPDLFGCDGTFYGIEMGTSWYSTKMYWWSFTDEDWHALRAWYDETIVLMEKYLPASGSREKP